MINSSEKDPGTGFDGFDKRLPDPLAQIVMNYRLAFSVEADAILRQCFIQNQGKYHLQIGIAVH